MEIMLIKTHQINQISENESFWVGVSMRLPIIYTYTVVFLTRGLVNISDKQHQGSAPYSELVWIPMKV